MPGGNLLGGTRKARAYFDGHYRQLRYSHSSRLQSPSVAIDGENDVMISFHGSQQKGDVADSVTGTIDRVTGDAWAEQRIFNVKGSGSGFRTTYVLKCIPAQRKF